MLYLTAMEAPVKSLLQRLYWWHAQDWLHSADLSCWMLRNACPISTCSSLGSMRSGRGESRGVVLAVVKANGLRNNGSVSLAEDGPQNDGDPSLHSKDVSSLCQDGRFEEALACLECMKSKSQDTYRQICGSFLRWCIKVRALKEGRRVHARIRTHGVELNAELGNHLITLYVKCGKVDEARRLFDGMVTRDVVTWNALIHGYEQAGNGEEAFRLFDRMQQDQVVPDRCTFSHILCVCASNKALAEGRRIHDQIRQRDLQLDNFVGNNLVNMYAKCGNIRDALEVFEQMQIRDVVVWSCLIGAYASQGLYKEARMLFRRMLEDGVRPNRVTFLNAISSCVEQTDLEDGKWIHSLAVEAGVEAGDFVSNALIDMYAKCGCIVSARQVFDKLHKKDLVSWSVMIAGYAQHGLGQQALELFNAMEQEGVTPEKVAVMAAIQACASLAALEEGKRVHTRIGRAENGSDLFVSNALIDMYVKCGSVEDAELVFTSAREKDVVSWNSLIMGYGRLGHAQKVLHLYKEMQHTGVTESEVTFIGILRACTELWALEEVKGIHEAVLSKGFENNVTVMTTLLDTYAKCGSIDHARQVFDAMPARGLVSWNAMILGYAQHGRAKVALSLFKQMQLEGMKPDQVTFVSVLSACSHGGLVDLGRAYFDLLIKDHELIPQMEHYACMVDLLGRAGHLEEALDFINQMPFRPNDVIWRGLLGACTTRGNILLGNYAAQRALELQPRNPAVYVLLSNLYAGAGRLDEVGRVRKLMKEAGLRKEPGRSWIEVHNLVHSFHADDLSHPEVKEVYTKLERVSAELEAIGYVALPQSPDLRVCED